MRERIGADPGDRPLHSAIDEYLSADPKNELDLDVLIPLCEAAEEASTPQELYYAGWMWTEAAQVLPDDDDVNYYPFFQKAQTKFKAAMDVPTISRFLKAQCELAVDTLPIYGLLGRGDLIQIDQYLTRFDLLVFKAARKMLRLKYERDGPETSYLNTLTALIAINEPGMYLALPASPRFSHTSSEDAWNMVITQYQTRQRVRARVGIKTNSYYIDIHPEYLLRNQDYPSRHGLGTLEAFTVAMESPKGTAKYNKAHEHLRGIRERVRVHLDKGFERLLSDEEEISPQAWYQNVQPDTNPYVAEPALMQEATNRLESAYLGGELGPLRAFDLAGMYAEIGEGSAIRGKTDFAEIYFGRAHDTYANIFRDQRPEFAAQHSRYLRYLARIAQEAVVVQKAIALQDEKLPRQVTAYGRLLTALADSAIDSYENLYLEVATQIENPEPAFHILHKLYYGMTIGILAAEDPDRRWIALPSTPRQQGTAAFPGWDLTIYPAHDDGSFTLDHQSHIRFVEQDDPNKHAILENRNLLLVSPNDMGHDLDVGYDTLGIAAQKIKGEIPLDATQKETVRQIIRLIHHSTRFIGVM